MNGVGSSADLKLPDLAGQRSLRETVGDALRVLLADGSMQPGDLYSAPRLAEKFGISPTPVREALLDLVAEGQLEVQKNKGFKVTGLSVAELLEAAEVRLYLEPPAMGGVARASRTDADTRERIGALRTLAVQLYDAAREGHYLRYAQLDTQFHVEYLRLYGNETLAATVRKLRTRTQLFGTAHLKRLEKFEELAATHFTMIELGQAGKGEELEALTYRQIAAVKDLYVPDDAD
ncbi:GntR family transcriptional regulator [Brevibacterium album]|uniref:GntR family transcriptional regulator n=1 Tax=Brevibacterium album TaxID=417948 RepID=UPI00040677ED|nr:GntR family transcriptional regulator [Brevibacterium album]